MATLSSVPGTWDVNHYGGDTLTLEVTTSIDTTNLVWNAELRATKDAAVVDATFLITPPVGAGPALLTLVASDCSRLVSTAPVVARREASGSTRSIQQYVGVWDCQVSNNGLDPVTTVAQGTLTIEMDVTRPVGA